MKEYVVDWNKALGDTIKERVEALYVFFHEKVFPEVGERVFVLASVEAASVFECSSGSSYPSPPKYFAPEDPIDCGSQCSGRFRLFKSINIPLNQLFVFGNKDIAFVKIINFN
jgi:hypothetical protein